MNDVYEKIGHLGGRLDAIEKKADDIKYDTNRRLEDVEKKLDNINKTLQEINHTLIKAETAAKVSYIVVIKIIAVATGLSSAVYFIVDKFFI